MITPQDRINNVQELIAQEHGDGLYTTEILKNFRSRAFASITATQDFIRDCKHKNIPVIGYGAPAKSSVFLNYAGIRPEFIIEDTPLKQGKFTPGMSIPIVSPTAFDQLEHHPQVCFMILAWNFYDEIRTKIQSQRPDKQDIFVKYLPNFQVEGTLV